MYSLAGVAIVKSLRLGGSQDRSLFAHSRGGRKSEVKVLGGLVSSEPLSLACGWPSSSRVLTWSSLRVRLCPHLFP